MKALADYIHSKGLKFGMYSCVGTHTCAGYPGSFEHEFQDAESLAEWGVDFLKYDYCFKPRHMSGELLYKRMSLALKGLVLHITATTDLASDKVAVAASVHANNQHIQIIMAKGSSIAGFIKL